MGAKKPMNGDDLSRGVGKINPKSREIRHFGKSGRGRTRGRRGEVRPPRHRDASATRGGGVGPSPIFELSSRSAIEPANRGGVDLLVALVFEG